MPEDLENNNLTTLNVNSMKRWNFEKSFNHAYIVRNNIFLFRFYFYSDLIYSSHNNNKLKNYVRKMYAEYKLMDSAKTPTLKHLESLDRL